MTHTIEIKRFIAATILVLLAVVARAVPARPVTQDITLTDGSIVENVVLAGDEFFHYWLAPDGTRYQKTEEGFVALSESNSQQAIRRAVARKAAAEETRAIRRTQTLNIAPRGLLILVNFSDKSFRSENTQAEMDTMLNGQNYHYDISIGSARKYFYDQSNGSYNPHFDVVGPITLPKAMSYYGGNGTSGDGGDLKLGDMVLHACSIASGLPDVDLANYDNNNDGEVDFVYLIYAGYGEADGGSENTIWPASWDMQSAVQKGYTSLSSRATKSSYTYDGKAIGAFAYSPELNYYNSVLYPTRSFTSTNPMRNGIGTFCHEFSHVIGLPDYYDTDYGTNYDNYLTPGDWSLMDGGSYNGDGQVPPAYSIFDKYYVKWADPDVLNEPANVSLSAGEGRQLTSDGVKAPVTQQTTIYYLENRQKTHWDSYLPGHGMLVWKILYNSSKWDNNTPNNTANQPCVSVVTATGSHSTGEASDTYPGTRKVTSVSLFSQYPITNIEEQGSNLLFKFMGGAVCSGYGITFNGTKATLSTDTTECIAEGTAWSGIVTANNNCFLSDVTIQMGGIALSDVCTFSSDSTSATISIASLTGDIVIDAVAQKQGTPTYVTCDAYSWTASAKVNSSSVMLGDYTWNVAIAGGSYTGYDANRGAQFGTASNPATQVRITTSEVANCLIDRLTIQAAKGSEGTGEVEVYIGGTQVGQAQSLTSTNAEYTFTNVDEQIGALEIRYYNTAKALFLKAIDITFQRGTATPCEPLVPAPAANKSLRNGKIVITIGDKTYDILGREIR